jgi:hypothetical protein
MVVYIDYITASGNSISSQLSSSWQGNRHGAEKADGTTVWTSITDKITPAGSLSSSQPGGTPCWASPLAFGLIGRQREKSTEREGSQDQRAKYVMRLSRGEKI